MGTTGDQLKQVNRLQAMWLFFFFYKNRGVESGGFLRIEHKVQDNEMEDPAKLSPRPGRQGRGQEGELTPAPGEERTC